MSLFTRVQDWLDERFHWAELIGPLKKKTVPIHRLLLLVLPRRHHALSLHDPGRHGNLAAALLPAGSQ